MDRLTRAQRSWNMSQIRGKHTRPERVVRSLLHRLGYRFRLHVQKLPGKPDIVLAKSRSVVFVHGCFWHRHSGCRFAYTPKSRIEFWTQKFDRNVARHNIVEQELRKLGWRILVVWECEISNVGRLESRLKRWLDRVKDRPKRRRPTARRRSR
jgi:DNA mismatch endonuclease (patch repair protein)